MSQTAAAPTSSAIPILQKSPDTSPAPKDGQLDSNAAKFTLPKLRLEIRDLDHKGAHLALTSVDLSSCIAAAVRDVLRLLYLSPSEPTTKVPGTRSITFILRSMSGVAYTTGTELDDDHKEVHFSLDYIAGILSERMSHEITGVLTHELVHCFQYNGFDTCPGGLIEGIADWVRLNCDLAPPHWSKVSKGEWDSGYEHTGYFLDYIEKRFGSGSIRRVNEKLRSNEYDHDTFWQELFGHTVEKLWKEYGTSLEAST